MHDQVHKEDSHTVWLHCRLAAGTAIAVRAAVPALCGTHGDPCGSTPDSSKDRLWAHLKLLRPYGDVEGRRDGDAKDGGGAPVEGGNEELWGGGEETGSSRRMSGHRHHKLT
jgi:hypothetical protein